MGLTVGKGISACLEPKGSHLHEQSRLRMLSICARLGADCFPAPVPVAYCLRMSLFILRAAADIRQRSLGRMP